jgi:hypothetical protein
MKKPLPSRGFFMLESQRNDQQRFRLTMDLH